MRSIICKVFRNRRNNQISLTIPIKKVRAFKDKTPKTIRLKIEDIIW